MAFAFIFCGAAIFAALANANIDLLRREVPSNISKHGAHWHDHNQKIERQAQWAERIERHESKEKHGISASDVISKFNADGLCIRTCQTRNCHFEFMDKWTSPDRFDKCSFMGKDVLANYYKMGEGVTAMPRTWAVLLDPFKLKNVQVVSVNDQDSSSNPPEDFAKKALSAPTFATKWAKLKTDSIAKQKESSGRIENSEVNYVGIESDAIVGILFFKNGEATTTLDSKGEAAVKKFAQLPDCKDCASVNYDVPVFTYKASTTTKTTELVDLGHAVSRQDAGSGKKD